MDVKNSSLKDANKEPLFLRVQGQNQFTLVIFHGQKGALSIHNTAMYVVTNKAAF